MTKLFCICTEQICGHPPGERCGKTINEEHVHPHVLTEKGEESNAGWIRDECWERVNQTEKHPR
jgi:hypothetical protein